MTTATATRKVSAANAYDIYVEACAAAEAAAKACTPTPMIVGEAKAIFGPGSDEIDYSKKTYYVASGICGNASVRIKPARGAFVTMAKKRGVGSANYYGGGYSIYAWEFAASIRGSQSYEIACAAAKAAAGVLSKYGISCTFESYID